MRIIKEERGIAELCAEWRRNGLKVGFVPTMGALHAGHLKLVEAALRKSDRAVVSIFVNPIQFGEGEDLNRYPRNLQSDCAALEELGTAAVFAPEALSIYPSGFSTEVSVQGVSKGLCGDSRPGHFTGVSTVCAVLFGIVKPHVSFFGMKDAQQLAVIRRMTSDLRLGIEIEAVPIVREQSGLAMSSRNAYLSSKERKQAEAIYRGLSEARELCLKGEKSCAVLKQTFTGVIEKQPLLSLEYVETVDPDNMKSLESVEGRVLLAAAVFAGKTRLIDNVLIEPEV